MLTTSLARSQDNPPVSCNVDYDRDCGAAGCVVSAIANYTTRVQAVSTLSAQQINYALRFLVHFVGDITQPLHDENLALGGNDIPVKFNGTATNLHHIWDTNMPEELRGGYSLAYAKAWAANLTAEINKGAYQKTRKTWIQKLDITDAKGTALAWAQDANAYVCSVVLPNGAAPLEAVDLYPEYYNSAIPTIELQIAKAGYRLAAWLDAIAKNQKTGKETKKHRRSIMAADLTGRDLLPPVIELSPAKLRRAAVGWGCGHQH